MKLFIAFLTICLLIGVLPRIRFRKRVWILLGLCAVTCVGYYFFHQI